MSRFCVGIAKYDRFIHARCFEDVARALADALRALGHEVIPAYDASEGRFRASSEVGRLIMFGANNMTDPYDVLPPDAIVFNTEQVGAVADPTYFMGNHAQYRKHVIWDYSQTNAEALRKVGFEHVVYCPIGYVPSMTKINNVPEPDIDVLFYGSVNGRRREILDALDATDLRVARLFGIYGHERDALIARSKVVLNLHHYDRAIFEIFRVSHLLANKKCVVTEDGGSDPSLEALAMLTTMCVPRGEVVDTCQRLVADAESRRVIAERGFRCFSKLDFVEHVRRAVGAS